MFKISIKIKYITCIILILFINHCGTEENNSLKNGNPNIKEFSFNGTDPVNESIVNISIITNKNFIISEWLINESPDKPDFNNPKWQSKKPKTYKLSNGNGAKQIYAWIKDTNGNISKSEPLKINYNDIIKPEIIKFRLISNDPAKNRDILFKLQAKDNAEISGWHISESNTTPDINSWTINKPKQFRLSSKNGIKTVFAWVRDSSGNTNVSMPIILDYDPEPPVITTFQMIGNNSTSNETIKFKLEGYDNIAIDGWLISESPKKPVSNNSQWKVDKPDSYTMSPGGGNRKIFIWAKDIAGNVSKSSQISIYHKTHICKISWDFNRERAVNSLGGGYKVFYSREKDFDILESYFKKISYVSGESTPTSTVLNLGTGTWYIKVIGYSAINGGSKSIPSDEISINIPE